jgi:hypothetical protein
VLGSRNPEPGAQPEHLLARPLPAPGTAAPADILDAGLPSEALVLEVPIALTQTLTLEAADVALESERSGLKEKALGRTLDYRVGT